MRMLVSAKAIIYWFPFAGVAMYHKKVVLHSENATALRRRQMTMRNRKL